MIKVFLSIPEKVAEARGASRSMRSMVTLLEKSGDFISVSRMEQADIFIDYNNRQVDWENREKARKLGLKIVYSLRNIRTSLGAEVPKIDGFLVSSEFVANTYKKDGIMATNLPLPMIEEDVISLPDERSPRYLVIVNPIIDKGLCLFKAIIAKHYWRWDIIYKSYGKNGIIADNPKEIYKEARVVIMPSIWDEPAGRVIAESMLNGVPVIYSDRGGMRETANGGGVLVHIPKAINKNSKDPGVIGETAKEWNKVIMELWDNKEYYKFIRDKGLEASKVYLEENTVPRYAKFFNDVIVAGRE